MGERSVNVLLRYLLPGARAMLSDAPMPIPDEVTESGNHEQLLALGGRYYELYTGKKELD